MEKTLLDRLDNLAISGIFCGLAAGGIGGVSYGSSSKVGNYLIGIGTALLALSAIELGVSTIITNRRIERTQRDY